MNYNTRTSLKIQVIFKREEAAQLHHKVGCEYHSWAWSWAHARFEDGTYILRDVMEAHQIEDWPYLQASMQQLDPTNTEKWKRRIGGVRTPWEKVIVEHYGNSWREELYQCTRQQWKKQRDKFIDSICVRHQLPRWFKFSEATDTTPIHTSSFAATKQRIDDNPLPPKEWGSSGCISIIISAHLSGDAIWPLGSRSLKSLWTMKPVPSKCRGLLP